MGDKANSLVQCAQIINKAIDTHFTGIDVKIMAEPGRYFVTTANTVVTRIHSKREILNKNGSVVKNMYYINDGIYGTLSCVFNENRLFEPKFSPENRLKKLLIPSTIWGPSVDDVDMVVATAMLPDLQINDLIAFEVVGAYSLSISTTYNGQLIAKCRYYMERSIL